MQLSFETITPHIAQAYLKTSVGNRPLKQAKVWAYTRDMQGGNWRPNGESIIFNDAGSLVDGHHRLTACTKAGVPFSSVVVRGVAQDAQKTIDMGASRTIGDALAFHGYKNSNQVNAVTLALMSLANGRPRSANPSAQEVFNFVKAHPLIEQAAVVASRKHFPRGQAICGAIWFIAAMNGEEEKANAFLDVLISGVPSRAGCPAHVLREKVMRDMIAAKQFSLHDIHRLVAGAWEKFRRGESIKTMKLPSDFKVTGWPK